MNAEQGGALLAGLDIGGTKLGVCLGTHDGEVVAAERIVTDPDAAPGDLLARCLESLERMQRERTPAGTVPRTFAALGAACPGPFRSTDGAFLDPPNMPRWHGFPLRDWLRRHVNVPLHLLHDAKASILAEHLWGAARETRHAIFLTFSTGCGAGLLVDGRVIDGASGFAGEIGHIQLCDDGPVGYGRRGTVEGFGSGPGIVQVGLAEALACTQRGEATALRSPGAALTCEQICAAAQAGDPAALRAVDRCAAGLGRMMAMLVDILNPELFVLGTIGSSYADLFVPRLMAALQRDALPHALRGIRVVPSGLVDRGNQTALAAAHAALYGDSSMR